MGHTEFMVDAILESMQAQSGAIPCQRLPNAAAELCEERGLFITLQRYKVSPPRPLYCRCVLEGNERILEQLEDETTVHLLGI